jgi:hypothetical protein
MGLAAGRAPASTAPGPPRPASPGSQQRTVRRPSGRPSPSGSADGRRPSLGRPGAGQLHHRPPVAPRPPVLGPARPAAIPPRPAAGAAPPDGPVALRPTLRCRRGPPARWPGSSPRSPDRSASVGRYCGPGPRTGHRGPVLGDQAGQQAGRQRGGPEVLDLDLELVLLVGDREPAPVAVLPPSAAIAGVVPPGPWGGPLPGWLYCLVLRFTSTIAQGSGQCRPVPMDRCTLGKDSRDAPGPSGPIDP